MKKQLSQDKILLKCYQEKNNSHCNNLSKKEKAYLDTIAKESFNQKGIFSVLITLLVQKIYDSSQDIRKHQSRMAGGFSGRTVDTQFITPVLKKIDLPSMAESGWLTRSLEQPYPYTLDYKGKINRIKKQIERETGCQLICNGLIKTMRYYLRLVAKPDDFIKLYSIEIEKDKELKKVHKQVFNDLFNKYFLEK